MSAILPGLLICLVVTTAALGLQGLEERLFGRAWLDTLVLAILIGTALRTSGAVVPCWTAGIRFSAKTLLEIAVVLLGTSLSLSVLRDVGGTLLVAIAAVVVTTIAIGFGLARALGLSPRLAILVACGNAICGNSAIAAIAPVIGAEARDVTASIAFTAVLGILVVLGLPLLMPALGLSLTQYGILSGLTVYAVPQVLAATAPAGLVAVQIGTLVKLVRVLMLGPVIVVLGLMANRMRSPGGPDAPTPRIRLFQVVPWFILAFLGMVALRSLDLLPGASLAPLQTAANSLTIVSMAALGLGVDMRVVARAGLRVTAAVTLSLLALAALSLATIRLLGIA